MEQLQVESLSLRFEPPPSVSSNLQQQILQVIRERGALRHITKQSLEFQINQQVTDEGSLEQNGDEGEHESDDETPQVRQDKIWKAREEMLQRLAYAQNEILSALDFVSLLLSSKSAAAQTSMSPALKERVPVGSLEGHSIEKQTVSTASRQRLVRVSEGWKSESFQAASDRFSQAASRLERETQRQSRYWEQIASLKNGGWSISRLPSDSRAIGLHYGFPEAAPQFRNRSFALLQQNESGELQLDSRSIPENFTVVRVAIVRNGIETGSSLVDLTDNQRVDAITLQVRQARNAIFEEELFHEINREGRLIANQGVRSQLKAIEADVDSTTRLRIIQTDPDQDQISTGKGPDHRLAESIALSMRLSLLLEHKKTKERRSTPPSMMTSAPQALPEYAILRPVLAQLRHQASLSVLRMGCESLATTCSQAGLELKFSFAEMQGSYEQIDMQRLRQPSRTRLTTELGSGRKIGMEIETYLGSPIYGTIFNSKGLDFEFINVHASSFSTTHEAMEHLIHMMTLELISQTPEFEVLRPHSGEVALKAAQNVVAIVGIRLQSISLHIAQPLKKSYIWRRSGFQYIAGAGEKEVKAHRELRTYREVISTLSRSRSAI